MEVYLLHVCPSPSIAADLSRCSFISRAPTTPTRLDPCSSFDLSSRRSDSGRRITLFFHRSFAFIVTFVLCSHHLSAIFLCSSFSLSPQPLLSTRRAHPPASLNLPLIAVSDLLCILCLPHLSILFSIVPSSSVVSRRVPRRTESLTLSSRRVPAFAQSLRRFFAECLDLGMEMVPLRSWRHALRGETKRILKRSAFFYFLSFSPPKTRSVHLFSTTCSVRLAVLRRRRQFITGGESDGGGREEEGAGDRRLRGANDGLERGTSSSLFLPSLLFRSDKYSERA